SSARASARIPSASKRRTRSIAARSPLAPAAPRFAPSDSGRTVGGVAVMNPSSPDESVPVNRQHTQEIRAAPPVPDPRHRAYYPTGVTNAERYRYPPSRRDRAQPGWAGTGSRPPPGPGGPRAPAWRPAVPSARGDAPRRRPRTGAAPASARGRPSPSTAAASTARFQGGRGTDP